MNIKEAKLSIGKMVMSIDRASNKMTPVDSWHGPYKLEAVTKSGYAILSGLGDFRTAPSKIRLATPTED